MDRPVSRWTDLPYQGKYGSMSLPFFRQHPLVVYSVSIDVSKRCSLPMVPLSLFNFPPQTFFPSKAKILSGLRPVGFSFPECHVPCSLWMSLQCGKCSELGHASFVAKLDLLCLLSSLQHLGTLVREKIMFVSYGRSLPDHVENASSQRCKR